MMLIMKIVMMVILQQEVSVIYTLSFTAKTYLFKVIKNPMTNQKVIKKVQDDLYTDTQK